MANSENTAKIYAASFLAPYYQDNVWMGVVDDRSPEIPGYGDRLVLPTDDTDYSPTDKSSDVTVDQTDANKLKYIDPKVVDSSMVELVIDQFQMFNVIISPVQERRIRPDFRRSATEKSARKVREVVNSYIRGQFDAITPAGRNLSAISVASNAWGEAAHQTAVTEALQAAALRADGEFWPAANRVCITSPAVYQTIVKKLIADKLLLVQGATDTAVTQGRIVRYWDWNIRVDNSLGTATTSADGGNHTMYFMHAGVGLGFLGEPRRMKVVDSEVYAGTLLQGYYSYGAKVIEPNKLLRQPTTIT